MGIFDSFRKRPPTEPTPEINSEHAASLQLLLQIPLSGNASHFQSVIRAYEPTLRGATIATVVAAEEPGSMSVALFQVTWGTHRVEVVAFGFPMPSEVVEKCVQPAPYSDEDKERAYNQQAHALLYYKGGAANTIEQFIAVALVAGALCGEGGLAVLNEGARTSLPATLFVSDMGMKPSQFLRTLPPLYLFAGFVKYELEGVPGIWMRTHGLENFGLPNLATHARGHEQSEEVFDIFSNVTSYLLAQGPVLSAGHTMQIGNDQFMRLRELTDAEAVLDDGQPLLVAEFIRADQANSHIFGGEHAH